MTEQPSAAFERFLREVLEAIAAGVREPDDAYTEIRERISRDMSTVRPRDATKRHPSPSDSERPT